MESFRYSPHPEAKWISLAIVVLFVALLSVVLWHKPQETSQRPGVGEARAAAESLPPSQGLPSPELQEPEPETIVVQPGNEIIDSPVAEKSEARRQSDKIASTRRDISKTTDRKALPQQKKSTPEISRPVAVEPQDQKETKRDTAVAPPTAEVPESREEIVREWEASVAESQEPEPGISNVERERRARRLNNEGYTLMKQGRITEAIPLLEQSVRSFPKGTSDPYYGYALFNLARALRITGRPDLAVPLLEERIKIKDQQDIVARELSAARREAGNVQVTGIQYE